MIKYLLKLMPLSALINLVIQLLQYIVSKTKTSKDDQILNALIDMYRIIEPVIPSQKK